MISEKKKLSKSDLARFGLLTGAGSTTTLVASEPVFATTGTTVSGAVTDIQGMMTSINGLAGSALAVVLVVLGIYFAIGYGKKIMSKG